ncbi:MAG: hypothetical protein U0176_27030 [Bacteroidia bacterium]
MCIQLKNQNEKPVTTDKELLEILPYIHTQALKAVGKHPDFPKIASKEHYTLVVNEVRKLFINAGISLIEVPSFDHEYEVVSEIQKTEAQVYVDEIVREGIVSLVGGRVLTEVLEILDSSRQHRAKIVAFEELFGYVANMRTLADKEQYALLVGLKLAIASLEFWRNELNDRRSPYREFVVKEGQNRRRLPWADIIGGVVNCIGCGVGGTVAGCIGCASISSGLSSSWFGNQTKE